VIYPAIRHVIEMGTCKLWSEAPYVPATSETISIAAARFHLSKPGPKNLLKHSQNKNSLSESHSRSRALSVEENRRLQLMVPKTVYCSTKTGRVSRDSRVDGMLSCHVTWMMCPREKWRQLITRVSVPCLPSIANRRQVFHAS